MSGGGVADNGAVSSKKHCTLIVLSMTPEEMRKRIKQANETDDYVLSAFLYAVQIFDENFTEND